MAETGYPAAAAVAAKLQAHFSDGPGSATLAAVIDVAFWASLRREENLTPRVSLACVEPGRAVLPIVFEASLPLEAHALTKLAPAVERPGIHLGVWIEGGELRVWGATRSLPPLTFVLEVVAPGLLVIKQSRGEDSGKFVNLAVLQGDQVKVIDQRAASVPDCPELLTSLLGLESRFASPSPVNVLIQLAVSMREHGRGGTLLVTPPGGEDWRESILHPITYAVAPHFTGLAEVMRTDPGARPNRRWQDALGRAVATVAGLTAVDGAAVITTTYELRAFGAKIVPRRGSAMLTHVIVTEPVEEAGAVITDPVQLGGTRHLSAAQFVHDQRDSLALVASQDGRFTVFAWSGCEGMVHAHRIDALLL